MKSTQTLTIQFEDQKGKPLPLADIYIDLLLFTNSKYCYGFRFGPTDHQGKLRIAFQDIEKKRAYEAKFSLMDYNTPLDKCDEFVKIKIPTAEELKKAYDWQAKALNGVTEEAKKWLNATNKKIKADEVSVKLQHIETIVSISCSMTTP
jgi:hypothetical protein